MMQKKVGIVTINDYKNYGNRLQNYALVKLLEKEGLSVLNGICGESKKRRIGYTSNALKRAVKRITPSCAINFFWRKTGKRVRFDYPNGDALLRQRFDNFERFSSRYATIEPPILCSDPRSIYVNLKKRGVDYLITGSDQVWNPFFAATEEQFLTFAPKEKRLSFAASIGVDEIPEEQRERYKKNLSEMKYISVREERAAELVKELTGREVDVVPDPTLLLPRADWEQVAKKPDLELKEPYICTYFLGEEPEAVKQLAQKTGLPVYALNSRADERLYTIDPAEFLYMLRNAAYVLTDSFHAVAFSIKFCKEFYVFERKEDGVCGMFSRIETITKRFGLENRIGDRDEIREQPSIEHWDRIEEELACERVRIMKKLLAVMEA